MNLKRHRYALLLPIGAVLMTILGYVVFHPYPAGVAGLYLLMGERLVESPLIFPDRIPYYAPGGIPFAYPPLAMMVAGLFREIGFTATQISIWLPQVYRLVYVIPAYFFIYLLLDDKESAAISTVCLAVAPSVLTGHVIAGGIVRSFAYLAGFTTLFASLKWFKTGWTAWLILSILSGSATVLSHPTIAVFIAVSSAYFATIQPNRDISIRRAAVVATGVALVISPWLWTVISTHGIGVFVNASGTHATLGPSLGTVAMLGFLYTPASELLPLVFALSLFGLIYVAGERKWWIIGWYLTTALIIATSTSMLIIGSIASGVFLTSGLDRLFDSSSFPQVSLPRLVTAFLLLFATFLGAVHVAGDAGPFEDEGDQFGYNENDLKAMEWARSETSQSATFAVQGQAGEWFPYFAHRDIGIGYWGREWLGSRHYTQQKRLHAELSNCKIPSCVEEVVSKSPAEIDYVYIRVNDDLVQQYQDSPKFTVRYRSGEVLILQVN